MLVFLHIFLIAISNILVQYPFELYGYQTTYGAFTYPMVFILSDLATRLYGVQKARNVVFSAMVPGLLLSFLITIFTNHSPQAFELALRVATACFLAYISSQLLDIYVFSRFRNTRQWFLAPTVSSSISNVVDTFVFFFVAFYHSSNDYFAHHWLDIACVDLMFKWCISVLAFVPIYGMILKTLSIWSTNQKMA